MVQQISPNALAQRLAAGEPTYLLDVRQPQEHAFAALPGSVLVPLQELPQRVSEVQPPDGALVVVYCHHGVRSMHAALFLEQTGFTQVQSLAGGLDAWSVQVDPKVPRYQ